MTNWFQRILSSYDYHRQAAFLESLVPSFKYCISKPLIVLSVIYPALSAFVSMLFPAVYATLGIDGGAFIALIVAFVAELMSGIVASHIRGEQFSSLKLSRFTLKLFIYLVIIAVPFHWSQNFESHHKDFMAACFGWLQNFLIVQIVFENLVSILENMAVIYGQDKTAWINKIKDKLTTWWA